MRIKPDKTLLDEALTEKVIGVFFEVYNELGYGFLENVYEKAMSVALRDVGLQVSSQVPINVHFRGTVIGEYRADLVVENRLILELKAVSEITSVHETQLVNYLKATQIPLGLLLNFGPKPGFKRKIFT